MNLSELSPAQLRRAASIKERVAKLQRELSRLLGAATPAGGPANGRRKKRTMSAASRKKLSDFHKARWAKIRAAKKK